MSRIPVHALPSHLLRIHIQCRVCDKTLT